jgi:hypothetical protein
VEEWLVGLDGWKKASARQDRLTMTQNPRRDGLLVQYRVMFQQLLPIIIFPSYTNADTITVTLRSRIANHFLCYAPAAAKADFTFSLN